MKKGFTLAELLGVIVIISVLLILVVPTIINSITKNKQPAENTGKEIIYNAADQYINANSTKYPKGKSGKYCIPIKKNSRSWILSITGQRNNHWERYIRQISNGNYIFNRKY